MAFNNVLLINGSMGTGIVSAAKKIPPQQNNAAIQCNWDSLGAATGVIAVQVSNDDVANEGLVTNWATLRDDPRPRVLSNSLGGSVMFQLPSIGYLWVRVAYASISGGGQLNVVINGN